MSKFELVAGFLLTWGFLHSRAEAQARTVDFGSPVADSSVAAELGRYWEGRDSIEHLCVMGHVETSPEKGRYVVIDSVRPGSKIDYCRRMEDVGAIALIDGGEHDAIIRVLWDTLGRRIDLYFVAAMYSPEDAYFVIRTSH